MKKIAIPFVPELDNVSIELSTELLDEQGQKDTIEFLNWKKEYPYRPISIFFVARSSSAIYIKYNIHGSMLRGIYYKDGDPVHEDSCVEFFCKLPDSDRYFNFEFNCIGTCSAASRVQRHEGVKSLSREELSKIERLPSIGRRAFIEMEGMFEWELTVKIPFDIIGIDPDRLPEKIYGNFYKCADGTNSPHYVTWNQVLTPEPDFHCPEFFGELYF